MAGTVPAWIKQPAPVATTAGVSPAPAPAPAASGGASFTTLVVASVAATAIVLWARGKMSEESHREETERLFEETARAQQELDAEREDISLAHDWTTAHPLALRYGQ